MHRAENMRVSAIGVGRCRVCSITASRARLAVNQHSLHHPTPRGRFGPVWQGEKATKRARPSAFGVLPLRSILGRLVIDQKVMAAKSLENPYLLDKPPTPICLVGNNGGT